MDAPIGQQAAKGLFFLVFGSLGWLLGRDMPIGVAGDMGVGYVPRALSYGCIAIGAVILGSALTTHRSRLPINLDWKPALIVTVLVLAFAVLLPWLGLPLTIIAIVLAAAVSGEKFSWPVLTLTALGLAVASTLLFHTLLRLQVPVWPALKGLAW